MVTAFLLFQLNYLNLALDLFSAAAVSPVYYVFFTSCTIISNALLFQGFDGQTVWDVVADLFGFGAMVAGVFLLYHPQNIGITTTTTTTYENGNGNGSSHEMEEL